MAKIKCTFRAFYLLMIIMSFQSYGQDKISIPIEVHGSKWSSEICLSNNISPYYARMSPSGRGEYFDYDSNDSYSLAVECQPKSEECKITSNASGIVSYDMQPVVITCMPKVRQPEETKRTYTWALDESFNRLEFPLLDSINTEYLGNEYYPPATEALVDANQHKWLGSGPSERLQDFSLLYRTVSTILPYSDNLDTSSYFNNWAFIRKLISWGGDTSAGAQVIAPSSHWVNTAHRNGVKVYGMVFIGDSPQYTGLTDKLIGSSSCPDITDESNCTYTIPTIEKLTILAKTLKLDGWFLNIEAGLNNQGNYEGRSRIRHLSRLMQYKLPEIENRKNVNFIVYSNVPSFSPMHVPNIVGDDLIANFGETALTDLSLDNATGLTDDTVLGNSRFNQNNPQPYLMYLDEVYSRQTIRNEEYPVVRIESAKQTQCQYFNGIPNGNWRGFKEYTLAKYPDGVDDTKLICGGNTSPPVPKRVIKITLANDTSVSIDNGEPCTNDYTSPALWPKTCMLEVDTDKTSITISFTGKNVLMGLFDRPPYNQYGIELIPIVTAKWWSLSRDSSMSDEHFFNAFDYVTRGLKTYKCTAGSMLSQSCQVDLPSAEQTWNIDTGSYGKPTLLNFITTAQYASFTQLPLPQP